jgi:hypothetical protein
VPNLPTAARFLGAILCSSLTGTTSVFNFGINGAPIFCVPREDIDPDLIKYADVSLFLKSHGAEYPHVPFAIELNRVRTSVPAFRLFQRASRKALTGTISFLPLRARGIQWGKRARHVTEIWHHSYPCQHPTIKEIQRSGKFLVKCNSRVWDELLLGKSPTATLPPPNVYESVIATCWETQKNGETQCERVFRYKTFLIDYYLSVANAPSVKEMDMLIEQRVSAWERNCET